MLIDLLSNKPLNTVLRTNSLTASYNIEYNKITLGYLFYRDYEQYMLNLNVVLHVSSAISFEKSINSSGTSQQKKADPKTGSDHMSLTFSQAFIFIILHIFSLEAAKCCVNKAFPKESLEILSRNSSPYLTILKPIMGFDHFSLNNILIYCVPRWQ